MEEYIYNKAWKKVLRSLALDVEHLTKYPVRGWEWIWKKYAFLALNAMHQKRKKDAQRLHISGRDIYIPNPHDINIGVLQSTFVDNIFLKRYIPQSGIVLDIGAHTGEFALFAEMELKAKRIFSFEPIFDSYHILQKNKPSDTFFAAVGTGKYTFMYIPEHTSMSSAIPDKGGSKAVQVSWISPDTIPDIASLPEITLTKIDVEGAEADCMKACTASLRKSKYILVEISFVRSATMSTIETIEYLKSIVPSLTLIAIGREYGDGITTQAADMLFQNTSL